VVLKGSRILRPNGKKFPAGSEFNWGGCSPADDGEQALKEVSEFLASRGMKLSKPQK